MKGNTVSRTQRRAGSKALVCFECVKAVTNKPGITARNVGSFKGRPGAFIRHRKNGHGRTAKPITG